MKYLAIALILLSGIVFAHTVTINFATRIGSGDTLHVNNTDYNTPFKSSFSALPGGYFSVNNSHTMSAIISAGTLLNSTVNNTYYRMLENPDTVMALHLDNSTLDGSSYGNNGTPRNGVDCSSSVSGHLNTACNFDGTDDYINSSSLAALETSGYTISVWINTPSLDRGIFSQAGDSSHRMELYLANGQPQFLTFEGGAASLSSSAILNDGQWHHIAVTKNGATGRLYVDGLLGDSQTTASITSTNELVIGGRYDKTSLFLGSIDEVFVYDHALSADEVHDIYVFDPRLVLAQMKQDSTNNRFLVSFTNGTYADIDDKAETIALKRIVSSTIGRFFVNAPENYPIFIRLEYPDIDIQNTLAWSGIGRLVITNNGNTDRNIPNISLGLVR